MRLSPDKLSVVLKALADTTRLQVLTTLIERGETCVCELIEECSCSAPTLSFHLRKLSAAGLITSRKAGKWIFYRPDADGLARLCESLGTLLNAALTPGHHTPEAASCLDVDGCLPTDVDGPKAPRRKRAGDASPV